jgi:hypothetical protein
LDGGLDVLGIVGRLMPSCGDVVSVVGVWDEGWLEGRTTEAYLYFLSLTRSLYFNALLKNIVVNEQQRQ